ncbi:cadherin-like domain-containing protein, partial [Aquabacterium sp.]|uniref:cadherin-like domain-containing protein n=1 Tax=Aquabacterium sp. TaxID=1872578 RepID=UPI002488D4F1
MPKSSAHAPSGVVSTLQGRANVIRAGEEAPQALKLGDAIAAGDVILAAADTRIEVSNSAGPAWLPHDLTVAAADAPARTSAGGGAGMNGRTSVAAKAAAAQDLDDVLGAVDRGDADAATAAGLAGGGGASLSGGLRVDRVIEVVTPQAFSESAAREGVAGLVQTTAPQASTAPADVPTEPATPANVAPSVGNYSQVTKEDNSVSGQVQGSDANGDSLNYSKASDPQHGKVVVNEDGSYTYTPDANYHGGDSFTVLVSDGQGGTALSTVNIEVTPVNDTPKIDGPSGNIDPVTGHYTAQTDEDKPVSGKVSASDVDGDTLTFAK